LAMVLNGTQYANVRGIETQFLQRRVTFDFIERKP
jgi:hypothetical protein